MCVCVSVSECVCVCVCVCVILSSGRVWPLGLVRGVPDTTTEEARPW